MKKLLRYLNKISDSFWSVATDGDEYFIMEGDKYKDGGFNKNECKMRLKEIIAQEEGKGYLLLAKTLMDELYDQYGNMAYDNMSWRLECLMKEVIE